MFTLAEQKPINCQQDYCEVSLVLDKYNQIVSRFRWRSPAYWSDNSAWTDKYSTEPQFTTQRLLPCCFLANLHRREMLYKQKHPPHKQPQNAALPDPFLPPIRYAPHLHITPDNHLVLFQSISATKALPSLQILSFTVPTCFSSVIQAKSLMQSQVFDWNTAEPPSTHLVARMTSKEIFPASSSPPLPICPVPGRKQVCRQGGTVGKGSNVISLPGKHRKAWHKQWLWDLMKDFGAFCPLPTVGFSWELPVPASLRQLPASCQGGNW